MGREWYDEHGRDRSPGFGPGEELATIEDFVRTGFVAGTAARVRARDPRHRRPVPVDPVITRANWPGMTTDEAVAYIESLGERARADAARVRVGSRTS